MMLGGRYRGERLVLTFLGLDEEREREEHDHTTPPFNMWGETRINWDEEDEKWM